jgi:hypothetical protein
MTIQSIRAFVVGCAFVLSACGGGDGAASFKGSLPRGVDRPKMSPRIGACTSPATSAPGPAPLASAALGPCPLRLGGKAPAASGRDRKARYGHP